MSSKETPPETTTEKKETSSAVEDSGLFGINFNNIYTLGAMALIGVPLIVVATNILKSFLYKEQQQQQPAAIIQPSLRRVPRYTDEEIRQMKYQQELDLKNKRTGEQEYLEALRMNKIIGQNNNDLSKYNVHKNYEPHITEFDNEVDIIDDNQVIYNNYVEAPKQNKPILKYNKPQEKPLVYHAPENSLLISPEEIDIYTDSDANPNAIPAEFTNVGNRPEPFENIKGVEQQQQQEESEDDIYNIDNYEISEEDLKKMEAQAYAQQN